MAEKKQTPKENLKSATQVTNLDTTNVEVIEAEMVRVHQSVVQEITAEEVALHQAAAFDVTTAEISTHESALILVNAREVELNNSAAGAIRADTVQVNGPAGVVLAQSANIGNTYARFVVGDKIATEKIETLLLLGNHVEGDVQTVVDTRGALIAGMVGGLLAGVFLLVGRLVFGRRS